MYMYIYIYIYAGDNLESKLANIGSFLSKGLSFHSFELSCWPQIYCFEEDKLYLRKCIPTAPEISQERRYMYISVDLCICMHSV